MTDQQAKLLEMLIDRQKEMLSVLEAVAETQMLIAEALSPSVIVNIPGDDGPMTMQ